MARGEGIDLTEERIRAGRRWLAVGLAGYGFMLAGAGVFAGLVEGHDSMEYAPLVIVTWLQLATCAVVVPLWVCGEGAGGLGGVALRIVSLVAVGLAGLFVTTAVAGEGGWGEALLLEGLVGSFAVGSAGVSTLVLAAVRRVAAAQILASVVLLGLLALPMLANPVITWVTPAHRRLAIDCTSYSSALVVTAYAAEMDFYRGPGMYEWSVAGDYAFSVPRPLTASLLYLGTGLLLVAVFRPLRPRLMRR